MLGKIWDLRHACHCRTWCGTAATALATLRTLTSKVHAVWWHYELVDVPSSRDFLDDVLGVVVS